MNSSGGTQSDLSETEKLAMSARMYSEAMNQYSMMSNWANYNYAYGMQGVQNYQQAVAQGYPQQAQGYPQQAQMNQVMAGQMLGYGVANTAQIAAPINPPLPPTPHPDDIKAAPTNSGRIGTFAPPQTQSPSKEILTGTKLISSAPTMQRTTPVQFQKPNLSENSVTNTHFQLPPRRSPSPPPLTISPPPMPPTFPWFCVSMFSVLNQVKEEESRRVATDNSLNGSDSVNRSSASLPNVSALQESHTDRTSNEYLPEKLLKLFTPVYCGLCNLPLSSNIVATDHYKGKKHKRRIEQWLEDNPQDRIRAENSRTADGQRLAEQNRPLLGRDTNPWTTQSAQNPFSMNPPYSNGSANYDEEGRFQKQNRNLKERDNVIPRPCTGANALPLGGQGNSSASGPRNPGPHMKNRPKPLMGLNVSVAKPKAGLGFRNPTQETPNRPVKPSDNKATLAEKRPPTGPSPKGGPPPKKKNAAGPGAAAPNQSGKARYDFCGLCNVTLGCKSSADQHYAGKRHREAMKKQKV